MGILANLSIAGKRFYLSKSAELSIFFRYLNSVHSQHMDHLVPGSLRSSTTQHGSRYPRMVLCDLIFINRCVYLPNSRVSIANTNEHRRVEGWGWGIDIPRLEAQWVLNRGCPCPFPRGHSTPMRSYCLHISDFPLRASVSPALHMGWEHPPCGSVVKFKVMYKQIPSTGIRHFVINKWKQLYL